MKYNPNIHHRRSIRLQNYDYSQEGLYFVTICAKNHICLFGEIVVDTNNQLPEMQLNELGEIVQKCWLEIPQHYPNIVLHEFVVMPNHVHGILEITTSFDNGTNVGVEYFRPVNDNGTNAGVEYFRPSGNNADTDVGYGNIQGRKYSTPTAEQRPNCESGTIGAILRGFKIGVTKQSGYSPWQRNFHEHIIRNLNEYTYMSHYIINNPANWNTDKFYTK